MLCHLARAISRSSRHRPKEELVDGDYLFDGAGADVSATSGPRVAGQDNAAFVLEAQCGGAMVEVHGEVRTRIVSKACAKGLHRL